MEECSFVLATSLSTLRTIFVQMFAETNPATCILYLILVCGTLHSRYSTHTASDVKLGGVLGI